MAPKRRQQNQTTENNSHGSRSSNSGKSRLTRRDDVKEAVKEKRTWTDGNYTYICFVLGVALLVGWLHRGHQAHMFESDRHFSHLSTLERELAFRTEMGLYFSYYKTMIESPTFVEGLSSVMRDNVTEYPLVINTLKRFNLYPEVMLAMGYRTYEAVAGYLGWSTKTCWTVNRGKGLEPVQSCEGLGEPSYFYVEWVFLLNGAMMSIFFLFGTYLGGTIFGGILTVACFFFNHGECTRVQWTPPLRESFAYPFFVLEMFIVTYIIRCKQPNYKQSAAVALACICFMLPWQFAQFCLLTQTFALFGTYVLGFLDSKKTLIILSGQMVGLVVSCVMLFGNEMLLTSFYTASLLTVLLILILEPVFKRLRFSFLVWAVQGGLLAVGTMGLKMGLSKLLHVADDAHIGDIFRSKFTAFQNFHTMLYTCAPEFDFMEAATPWKLSATLLIPSVCVTVVVAGITLLVQEYNRWKQSKIVPEKPSLASGDLPMNTQDSPSRSHAEVVYHILQGLAFLAMAAMIMRLKLFWTPHLCLMTSLLASTQLFGWIGNKERHFAVLVLLLGAMSYQGVANISQQWRIMGEFSNYPMEEMVEWVKAHTPHNAVFAGPMPTMATIKLSTNRPIVNHPHYEDAGLRERTKKVYSMYSRKPLTEVHQHLVSLHIDYAILEDSWCLRQTRPGCAMPDIWDIEDEINRGKTPACTLLKKNPAPYFKRVFSNKVYQILQVIK